MTGKLRLGVNIDHVATIRNARGGPHPDPLRAAHAAAKALPAGWRLGIEWRDLESRDIDDHLPALRGGETGDDADRRLPVLLYLQWLWREAATEAGRLLRVLLLRLGAVPADPGAAVG